MKEVALRDVLVVAALAVFSFAAILTGLMN